MRRDASEQRAVHVRAGTCVALAGVVIVVACPNADGPVGGIPAGDVSLWIRLCTGEIVAAAALLAAHRRANTAAIEWFAISVPSWSCLEFFPTLLAPLSILPAALVLMRATGIGHCALLACICAALQSLGAAGWVFHYFVNPALPSLLQVVAFGLVWVPCAMGSVWIARRGTAMVPLAAYVWIVSDLVRMRTDPPIPSYLVSLVNADTFLSQLAPMTGDIGDGYAASLLGVGGAALLISAASRTRPWREILIVGVTTLGVLVGYPVAREVTSLDTGVRICAVSDPHRLERDTSAFAGGGPGVVSALITIAERSHDCAIIVFPEYSIELDARDLLTREQGRRRTESSVVLGGAFTIERDSSGEQRSVRNVVCSLHRDGGRDFVCSDPLDKLIFAPFGEAALFQGSGTLAEIGRRVTLRATG